MKTLILLLLALSNPRGADAFYDSDRDPSPSFFGDLCDDVQIFFIQLSVFESIIWILGVAFLIFIVCCRRQADNHSGDTKKTKKT